MDRLQQTQTQWAKSFPAIVAASSVASYTCTYDRGKRPCKKVFTRQCDLRRHQKNHTKPSKCPKCSKGFPSPKDLERHDSCVHNNTIKYFCPHDWCRDSIKPASDDWFNWGFRRKDHWQKHMRQEHSTATEAMQTLLKKGIPMAMLIDGQWVPVYSKKSEAVMRGLMNEARQNGKDQTRDDDVPSSES